MFGFGRKKKVDKLMESEAAKILETWRIYLDLYQDLGDVKKKKVSEYIQMVFEDFVTRYPDIFQIKSLKYIETVNSYKVILTGLEAQVSLTDRLQLRLAGQLFLTFLYAKGFCVASDVNEIGSKLQQIKNMGK